RSATQFEYLMLLTPRLMTMTTYLQRGLKAHGVGGMPYGKDRQYLYYGLLQALWISTLGYGHFRKRQEISDPSGTEATNHGVIDRNNAAIPSDESISMLDIVRRIWKHDRVLAIGCMLDAVFPVLMGFEGWGNSGRTRAEAF